MTHLFSEYLLGQSIPNDYVQNITSGTVREILLETRLLIIRNLSWSMRKREGEELTRKTV
jgi:hypothetical protein